MKPTKNKVFCRDCERAKMLFDTEKKAELFIKFNKEEIRAESGYCPQRSYYCLFCGGWHITSRRNNIGLSNKEQMFEQHLLEKENKDAMKLLNQAETSMLKSQKKKLNKEKRNKMTNELESQIKEMDTSQKEEFFLEKISALNKEIQQLLKNDSITDKEKLKELRLNLDIYHSYKKQYIVKTIPKKKNKFEEAREKEKEEWRLWAEKHGMKE